MASLAYAETKALTRNAVHVRASPPMLYDVDLTHAEARRLHGYILRVGSGTPMLLGPGNSRGGALWHASDTPGGPQRCTLVHNDAGHTYTLYAVSYAPGETQVYVLSYQHDRIAWCPLGSLHAPVHLSWTVHSGITNHFNLHGAPPACEQSAREFMSTPWALMHDNSVRPPAALGTRAPHPVGTEAPFLCVPRAGHQPTLVTPTAAQRGVWTLAFAGGVTLAAPSFQDAAQTEAGTWYTPLRTTLPMQSIHAGMRAGEMHDMRVSHELGAHAAALHHGLHPARLVLRPARRSGTGWELLCVNDSTEHPWILTHRDVANGGHGALVAWETTMHDDATKQHVLRRAVNVFPMHRQKRYDAYSTRGQDNMMQVLALDIPLTSSSASPRAVAKVHDVPARLSQVWHPCTEHTGVNSVYVHGDAFVLCAPTHAHGAAFTQFPRVDASHINGELVMAHSTQFDMLTPRASCVLQAASALPHAVNTARTSAAYAVDAAVSYLYDGAGRAL